MPIETPPVTTATTPLSDDEILAHLTAEAAKRAAAPRFKQGDVVETGDSGLIQRCQLLRPFGVAISYDPVDDIVRALFVDVRGNEMPLSLRGEQATKRG